MSDKNQKKYLGLFSGFLFVLFGLYELHEGFEWLYYEYFYNGNILEFQIDYYILDHYIGFFSGILFVIVGFSIIKMKDPIKYISLEIVGIIDASLRLFGIISVVIEDGIMALILIMWFGDIFIYISIIVVGLYIHLLYKGKIIKKSILIVPLIMCVLTCFVNVLASNPEIVLLGMIVIVYIVTLLIEGEKEQIQSNSSLWGQKE